MFLALSPLLSSPLVTPIFPLLSRYYEPNLPPAPFTAQDLTEEYVAFVEDMMCRAVLKDFWVVGVVAGDSSSTAPASSL